MLTGEKPDTSANLGAHRYFLRATLKLDGLCPRGETKNGAHSFYFGVLDKAARVE